MDRAGIAAAAIDFFHDHGGGRQAKPGTAIFLGNHRGQPAGLHQRVDELLRVGLLLVDLAEVFIGELPAQAAQGVPDFLVVIDFVEHRCFLVFLFFKPAWRWHPWPGDPRHFGPTA